MHKIISCYVSFNWRRTTGNSAAFIKVFVGKLTKNVTSNKYCVHALFPRCYLLRVRQYQKGNGCTFPSLFQVMKKPYSSTFTWQLGSNMYGSCRDKEGGVSLKIHLTWRNIKQPTLNNTDTTLIHFLWCIWLQEHTCTTTWPKYMKNAPTMCMFCTAK